MSGRFYRLVFFTPNPFDGSRFALAALVEIDGSVCVAAAKRFPCAACVGGEAALQQARMVVNLLSEAGTPGHARTIARMSDTAGPNFSLGEERRVPSAVADPVAWLRDFILPGGKAP